MSHPWYQSYDPGVPTNVDLDEFDSILDIFERSSVEYAEQPAFTNMDVSLSFSRLDKLSRDFAAWLQDDIGLQKGDRVAIMMPNLLQYPVALFGALRAGCVVVNVNPLYTPRELRHQLDDSGAKVIVILENFMRTLAEVRDSLPLEHVIVTRLGDLFPFPKSTLVNFVVKYVKKMVPAWHMDDVDWFSDVLKEGAEARYERPRVGHDDLAFLQYTGGTTGVAKGVVLSHGNIVANMQQAKAWVSTSLLNERQVVITALPLYHIFSLLANCMTFMRLGGENILITNPRDFDAFIKTISTARFTVITGVNTLYNALMNTKGFDAVDFSKLRVALGGGMAVQESVAGRWKSLTGRPLIEAYGLTETSPAVCINPLGVEEYTGSIGLPLPGTEVAIRDMDGQELATGENGEICIRGPQVTAGYWNRPEDTRAIFHADGWLRSGDIGHMDERGYIYIADRLKDMVLVSGFNVYPNEVEDVLVQHPAIVEAAVIGVPDETSGEAVKAFIVASDPELTREGVVAHCREQLTAYKVPKQIEFRAELPKTNVGKILRRALREGD